MAKVTDWEIPREFGLGNQLARWRVRGYSLIGPTQQREEFELEVTAFSQNQAEMRLRSLIGDGMHKVVEITKVGEAKPGILADGEQGREKLTRITE